MLVSSRMLVFWRIEHDALLKRSASSWLWMVPFAITRYVPAVFSVTSTKSVQAAAFGTPPSFASSSKLLRLVEPEPGAAHVMVPLELAPVANWPLVHVDGLTNCWHSQTSSSAFHTGDVPPEHVWGSRKLGLTLNVLSVVRSRPVPSAYLSRQTHCWFVSSQRIS